VRRRRRKTHIRILSTLLKKQTNKAAIFPYAKKWIARRLFSHNLWCRRGERCSDLALSLSTLVALNKPVRCFARRVKVVIARRALPQAIFSDGYLASCDLDVGCAPREMPITRHTTQRNLCIPHIITPVGILFNLRAAHLPLILYLFTFYNGQIWVSGSEQKIVHWPLKNFCCSLCGVCLHRTLGFSRARS